jgi:predicted DNA-binding WGR domain protein
MPLSKKLYFDDGTSRKRWHVRLSGKTQFVEFGKLGGALRESKKTFKTPKEAAAATDKLIAAKKREGYIEIKPKLLEISKYKGKKPATAAQIKSLEKRLGVTLPEEYQSFLLTRNGGGPSPGYIQILGDASIENVGVADIYGLFGDDETANSLAWALKTLSPMLPKGHLPIAGDSDIFTLSLRKKDFGAIHFWFHETDLLDDDGNYLPGAEHLLAGSFDEFLTRIAVVNGVPEEADEPASPSSGGSDKPARKPSFKTLFRLMKTQRYCVFAPAVITEIEATVKQLGDLSGIQDGEWPFINLTNSRILKCLLDAGLNPEILDTDRHTLLWQCASDVECVDLLLKHNVDIDRPSSCNGSQETGLMRAIFVKSASGVKKLLDSGANPTIELPSYISREIKYEPEILKQIDAAIQKWKIG